MQILTLEEISVHDYCNKFKGLKEQLGFQLIQLDFQILYPEKVNNLMLNWVLVKNHLIKILKTIKLQPEDKTLLSLISTLPQEHQDAVLVHLLIYIVPTAEIKKPQKRKRTTTTENQVPEDTQVKKSLNDKRESYMLVIPVSNEEDATLDRLKVTLLSKKLTLQPIFVVVGSLLNVQKVYAVIDDTWFECTSVLQSVDFTFKAFYSLKCAYPVETYNVWNFIQRAFFEIRPTGEKVSIKTRTLEKQIDNLLKELKTT
ncbi:uncharacterized protein LOC122506635 [Leptopilina heterotoma]|uniref:uncharacterized protein LOC122506635 n=1 Tax=Leptopilina heterotoma TaxID=63436 RepID=UPI001CAA16D6|nr:uncharacterized protein LOC122506635 [Leptopilina heterotoma]